MVGFWVFSCSEVIYGSKEAIQEIPIRLTALLKILATKQSEIHLRMLHTIPGMFSVHLSSTFILCCSSATTPGVPWGASLRWFHSKLEGPEGPALRVLRWSVPSWRGSSNSLRAISNSSSCSCVSLSHLFQANHHRGRGTESQRAECDVH